MCTTWLYCSDDVFSLCVVELLITEEKALTWATACDYLSKAESAAAAWFSRNFLQTWLHHHVVQHGLSMYLFSKPKPKRCQSERKAWTLRTALHAYHLSLRAACSSFACSMRLLSLVICSLWLLTVSLWLCEVLWKHALALLFNHQSLLKSTATAESPMTFYLFYLQTCSQITKIRPWLVECVSRKLWIRITFQPQISNISEFGRLGASIWLWGCLMSIVISGRSTNSLAGMRTYVTRMGTSLTRDRIQWMQVKNNRSRKSSNQTRWNRHHLSRSWVNGPWSELYLGQSLMILHWAENQILGMSWVQQFSIWNCS